MTLLETLYEFVLGQIGLRDDDTADLIIETPNEYYYARVTDVHLDYAVYSGTELSSDRGQVTVQTDNVAVVAKDDVEI